MATSVEKAAQIKAMKLLRTSAGIFAPTSHANRRCESAFSVSIEELIAQVVTYIGIEDNSANELALALNVARSVSSLEARRKHLACDRGISVRTLIRREDESIEDFVKQFSGDLRTARVISREFLGTESVGLNVGIETPIDSASLSLTELGEEIAKLGAMIDDLTARRNTLSSQLNLYISEMSKRSQ